MGSLSCLDLLSNHRHAKMRFLLLLGIIFAAVSLVTSSPAGKELHARQLSNDYNPRQFCGEPVEKGGCPSKFPCELEQNPMTGIHQKRCPCYGFCSAGLQICENGLDSFIALKYCVSKKELLTSQFRSALTCVSSSQRIILPLAVRPIASSIV